MTETQFAPFLDFAKPARVQIDAALEQCTRYDADCPPSLVEAIRYCLLAPGKRLRPLMVLMAADACGSTNNAAMPAACAVEMIHTYSLVHDDLPAMDDDHLRRGQPTCHVKFGEALAILVGDALLAQAFEVLATGIQPPTLAGQCCQVLATAAGPSALVGGQVDDLNGLPPDAGIEDLERIHHRKTGALFRVSLRLGAIIGGAADDQIAAFDRYGRNLGLAFQVVDDLLDIQGESQALGKTVGKDAAQGKLTYPTLLGEDASRRLASDLLLEARDAVSPFCDRVGHLIALTYYVLDRNH